MTVAIVDQPPPIATDRRPAWDIVIEYVEQRQATNAYGKTGVVDRVLGDMRDRDTVGWERYGVPLTSKNGRDHLMDAYAEALDLVVYLAAELDEHGVGPETLIDTEVRRDGWRLFCVQSMLWDQVRGIFRLRALIEERAA